MNCGAPNSHYQQKTVTPVIQETIQQPTNEMSQIFGSEYYSPESDQRSYANQLNNNVEQQKKAADSYIAKRDKNATIVAPIVLACACIALYTGWRFFAIIAVIVSLPCLIVCLKGLKVAPTKNYKVAAGLYAIAFVSGLLLAILLPL
jgi:hypothetical protein